MGKNKFKKILTKTTLGFLLMSSVVPYNVLAGNPIQSTIQGTNPNSISQTGTYHLTQEQIEAMNKITTESGLIISPKININSPEPVRVIVEFKQAPAKVAVLQQQIAGDEISLKDATKVVNDTHQKFKDYVQTITGQKAGVRAITPFNATSQPKIQITQEYKHAFNGVAMTLPGTDVEKLLESGLVNRIFNDHVVKIDPIGPEGYNADNLKAGNAQSTTTTSQAEKLSVSAQNNSTNTLKENSIPLPGIEDLHTEGVTGAGIKVGVLDTGIDYNHPDLKNVYKGYRKTVGEDPTAVDQTAVKGWDFVDNDADPMETTYQDWLNSGEPDYGEQKYYTSHGTHVSGTIAAQGENTVDYPALGVAPDVDLYGYRVLGPYGSGSSSSIIGGIDKAVQDGMDVINLSLGVQLNDPLLAESVAINNATLAGVTCVIAAGNAGPGEKTLGSPGTAALGITVGASDFPMGIPTASATVGSENFDNMMLLGKGFKDNLDTLVNQSYPIVFVGLGGQDDYKDENGQPIDLAGKVALVERGTHSFVDKIANAKNAGAAAVIIFNNVDGQIDNYLASDTNFIPAFRMTKADGERLKAAASSPITFSNIGSVVTDGNHLADFSSRGPTTKNYDIKPDVVGPGVSVYSTYPEYIHSPEEGIDYSSAYARISGTSMATPHVAGIAALILQAHPDYTPFDVKAALMNTADKLSSDYSVYEVGAGLVDVKEAVHADVSIKVMDKTQNMDQNGSIVTIDEETGSIAYGTIYRKENDINEESRRIVIKNKGTQQKEFGIHYVFSKAKNGVLDAVSNKVEMTTSVQSITVAAGESADLTAAIRVPGTAEMGRYEGYVNIVNHVNPQESYRLPFAVRVVDKGINSMELSNPSISTVLWDPFHPFLEGPFRSLIFKLNSPVKSVRTLIYDKEGRTLGSSSLMPIDAENVPLDQELFLNFSPYYYPFIGDPEEEKTDINTPLATLPEGQYKLKFRAVDEDGKTYEKEQVFVVDNTLPKLTFKDRAPGVYEVKDSDFTQETINGNAYNAFWVHANVNDEGANLLAPLGMTQSSNLLWYYQDQKVFPDGDFPIENNGDVKFGITKDEVEKGTTLILFPMDKASNAHLLNEFYPYAFVKEGTPYVVPTYDKQKVYKNDTLTMTLSLNNVEKLMSGTYDVGFYKNFEFVDVKVNKEFQDYAKENGLTVTVDEPVVKQHPIYEWSKNTVNAGAHISGDGFEGINGDINFLDVTFKLVDDHWSILYDTMDAEENTKTFSYTKFGESTPTTITSYNLINSYKIIPKHSYVESFLRLEPFNEVWDKDLTKLGAKVYALSSTGEKYPGTVDSPQGYFHVKNIPLSKDPYDIVVEVPGYLKSIQRVDLDNKTTWGEEIGAYKWVGGTQPEAAAGDVNGDGVIDVLDVKQVANIFGQQDNVTFKIEDLNQDGIVNATDMNYLVKNLYKSNPDATVTPKEKVNGKYATDFFNMLGIATPINTLKNPSKSNHTAALNWLAAVDAKQVKLEQSIDKGVTWSDATTVQPVTVDSDHAVVTGLIANTSYEFRVKVTGGLNEGLSNVVSLTTDEKPGTPPVTKPIVPKAPIIHSIDDNDTTITGKADANVNISVKINGDVVASGKANAEGNFSFVISPQQAGTLLTVSATNAAGNHSEVTSITVLDRTAPIAPKINVIDDNDSTISGSVEANTTIVVKNKDAVVASGQAIAEGNFSFVISPQKAGTVLTVSATDAAGNHSEVTSITVLDRTAPNAPKINKIDDNDTSISGSAEANATIVVSINGKTIATGKANLSGVYSIKINKQKAGTVISVAATDKSGNESTAAKIRVIDKTAPNAQKISSFTVKNKNEILITGTAEANSTIIVKLGTKVVANVKVSSNGTFTVKLSKVTKGTKNVSLHAIDNAGNKSNEIKRTVTIN